MTDFDVKWVTVSYVQ